MYHSPFLIYRCLCLSDKFHITMIGYLCEKAVNSMPKFALKYPNNSLLMDVEG